MKGSVVRIRDAKDSVIISNYLKRNLASFGFDGFGLSIESALNLLLSKFVVDGELTRIKRSFGFAALEQQFLLFNRRNIG